MELKTKYQYTYFIHPYVIDERKYDKYILNHYILTAGDRYKIVNDFSSQKEAEECVDKLVRLFRVFDGEIYWVKDFKLKE